MKFIRDLRDLPDWRDELDPPKSPIYFKTKQLWTFIWAYGCAQYFFGGGAKSVLAGLIIGLIVTPFVMWWDRRRALAQRVLPIVPWPSTGTS